MLLFGRYQLHFFALYIGGGGVLGLVLVRTQPAVSYRTFGLYMGDLSYLSAHTSSWTRDGYC